MTASQSFSVSKVTIALPVAQKAPSWDRHIHTRFCLGRVCLTLLGALIHTFLRLTAASRWRRYWEPRRDTQ